MVFLHFPSNHTDEEFMLQAKYAKLRKKKKALEQMKVPKVEVEKINPHKRPLDPKDAKELARKLILSGKVALPPKIGDEKKTVFKRPRTLERKILATGRSEGHGGLTPGYNANFSTSASDFQFEPFTPAPSDHQLGGGGGFSSQSPSSSSPGGSGVHNSPRFGGGTSSSPSLYPSSPTPSSPTPSTGSLTPSTTHRRKQTHESPNNNNKSLKELGGGDYHHHHNNGERNSGGKGGGGGSTKPKRGPTVYVQAHSISEEVLRHQFGKYGKIINIKINNPTVGFVTFDKVESAELTVQEMNGSSIDDISYDVQFARRQPNIAQLINDASASATWTAIATSHSQKSNHQDRRAQVVYEEPMEC